MLLHIYIYIYIGQSIASLSEKLRRSARGPISSSDSSPDRFAPNLHLRGCVCVYIHIYRKE